LRVQLRKKSEQTKERVCRFEVILNSTNVGCQASCGSFFCRQDTKSFRHSCSFHHNLKARIRSQESACVCQIQPGSSDSASRNLLIAEFADNNTPAAFLIDPEIRQPEVHQFTSSWSEGSGRTSVKSGPFLRGEVHAGLGSLS
jgi:predicted metalloprotease